MIPDPDLVETNDARAQLASHRRRARVRLAVSLPFAFLLTIGLLYTLVDTSVLQRVLAHWDPPIGSDATPAAALALTASDSAMPDAQAPSVTEAPLPSPAQAPTRSPAKTGEHEESVRAPRSVTTRIASPVPTPNVATGAAPVAVATSPLVETDAAIAPSRLPDVIGQTDDVGPVLSDTLPEVVDSLLPGKVLSAGDGVLDTAALTAQGLGDVAKGATKTGVEPLRTVVDGVGSSIEVPRLEVTELLHPEQIVVGLHTAPEAGIGLLPVGVAGSVSPAGPGGASGGPSGGSGVAGALQNGGGLPSPGIVPAATSSPVGLLKGLQDPTGLLKQTLRR